MSLPLADRIFAFFGGIFNADDPVITGTVVDIEAIPNSPILASSDYQAGSLTNELAFIRKYQKQLTDFWDLDTAEGEFLTTLGREWLGVARAVADDDSLYLKRIRATIAAARNTPYGLDQLMRIFSPNYVLIQEGLSGFGAVDRSFLGFYDNEPNRYDTVQTVAATTNVTAINPAKDTFTVDDATDFVADDQYWHDDGTNPERMYHIVSKSSNDLTISTRGYKNMELIAHTNLSFSSTNPLQIVWTGHGLTTGDTINVENSTQTGELPNDKHIISVIDPNTISVTIDNSGGVGGTCDISWAWETGLVDISGLAAGTLKKYEPATVVRAYIGSVTAGILRIRVTIESNPLTDDPAVAKFIVDILENAKIPGSRVEVVKI